MVDNIQLKKHYDKLIDVKRDYAKSIGCDFRMFEYDDQYIKFYNFYKKNYPFITTYNIINEYKIMLLYEMAEKYDEILYLDFDTIPITKENFFDVWDLNKGIAIASAGTAKERRTKPKMILSPLNLN